MARSAAHYKPLTRRDLSARQREVLELIAAGKTNGEIAERLGISLDGAKWHVSEILSKLDVDSREDAAAWWASQRGLGTRMANFARALAPLAQWKVAVPIVGVLGVAAAAVAVFALVGGGNDPDRAEPDLCAAGDLVLETIEARGPGGEVIFALTGRSERECTFEGIAGIALRFASDVNAQGTPAATSDVPVVQVIGTSRTRIAYATWRSVCPPRPPWLADTSLRHTGGGGAYLAQSRTFIVNLPPCLDSTTETLAIAPPDPLSSFLPDLGPDERIACFEDPKWTRQCEQVDRLQQALNTASLVDRNADTFVQFADPTEYTCPSDGFGGSSSLCRGAPNGELRQGFPITLHGGEGNVLSVDQLRDQLQAMITTANARVTSIGCPGAEPECDGKFIVAVAVDSQPAAFYLVFEPTTDGVRMVAAGFSGDNALEIRRGGTTMTALGPTLFTPALPPY